MKIRPRFAPDVVLESWRTVNEALTNMTEDELFASIAEEVSKPIAHRRADVVHRLHRRYCKLRQERELNKYLSG
jgi:hypothetical protein